MLQKIKNLEQKVKNLSFLNNLNRQLNTTLEPEKIADILASKLSKIIDYDIFSILFINNLTTKSLCNKSDNKITLKIKSNLDIKSGIQENLKDIMLNNFNQMTGYEMDSEQITTDYSFNFSNLEDDDKNCSKKPISSISNIKSDINIPLSYMGEEKIGFINLASIKKQKITGYHIEMLNDIATHISLALKNAIEHKNIFNIATKDGLTNIFNRMAFEEILKREFERAKETKNPITLLMLDLDNLKKINDTLGHQAGDKTLIEISSIMEKSIRKTDTLARYGGDEFAIIMPGVDTKKAIFLTERIRKNIEKNNTLNFHKRLNPTVSIGVSSFPNTNITNAVELIKNADDALYCSKKEGKNRISCKIINLSNILNMNKNIKNNLHYANNN